MRNAACLPVVLVLAGCSQQAPGLGKERNCQFVMRVPAANAPVVVKTMRPGSEPVVIDAQCTKIDCLRTLKDTVAVLQPDGSAWMAWPGQPGAIFPESTTDPEARRRFAELRLTAPILHNTQLPPPELPAELRTCGTISVEGGYGWHIIRNADDVWQRIHWARRPSGPEAGPLGPEAYPLVHPSGIMCGHAVQRAPRAWNIHVKGSGRVIEAAPDHEHPPAACLPSGALRVEKPGEVVMVQPDGSETLIATFDPAGGKDAARRAVKEAGRTLPNVMAAVLLETGQATVWNTGGIDVVYADGKTWARPPPPDGHDLAGKPVRGNAVRKRIVAAGGDDMLLAAERFQASTCRGHEVLHAVDLKGQSVTTLGKGDVMFLRLSWAGDAFYWLEAAPAYSDITRDESLSVTF